MIRVLPATILLVRSPLMRFNSAIGMLYLSAMLDKVSPAAMMCCTTVLPFAGVAAGFGSTFGALATAVVAGSFLVPGTMILSFFPA